MTKSAEDRERCVSTVPVTRYVVTHLNKDGERTLAHGAQGRYTYATYAEAQAQLDATMRNNGLDTLRSVYGLPLEVRSCPCYPGHFDPMNVWFD